MILNLLKSKIHCATVTEANLKYMGSITIICASRSVMSGAPTDSSVRFIRANIQTFGDNVRIFSEI